MRGIVFLQFESFVVERRGHDAYEDLLDAVAGRLTTDDPFVGPATYRDADLLALVDAEAAAEHVSRPDLLRDLGRFAFPRLAERSAWAMAGHRSLAPFLAQVQRLRRGGAGFEVVHAAPAIRIAYRAPKGLCALGEGLLAGAAAHFNAALQISKVACTDRGEATCVWEGTLA